MVTDITPWKATSAMRQRGPLVLYVFPEDDQWAWEVRFKDGDYPDTEEEGFLLEMGHSITIEGAKQASDEWARAFAEAISRPREG